MAERQRVPTRSEPSSNTDLMVLPLAVVLCCGTGLASGVLGTGVMLSVITTPLLLIPAVMVAAGLVVRVRRKRRISFPTHPVATSGEDSHAGGAP